jgi:hypothetical protein
MIMLRRNWTEGGCKPARLPKHWRVACFFVQIDRNSPEMEESARVYAFHTVDESAMSELDEGLCFVSRYSSQFCWQGSPIRDEPPNLLLGSPLSKRRTNWLEFDSRI